jgi:hypothetical protein
MQTHMQRQKTMHLNNMRERKNNVKKFVLATTGMMAVMQPYAQQPGKTDHT